MKNIFSGDADFFTFEHFNNIFNSIIDSAIIIDDRGTIEYVNDAFVDLFGYSREYSIGRNVKFLVPEPHNSMHDDYLMSFFKTMERKVVGKIRNVRAILKSGKTIPIELSLSELYFEEGKKVIGIIRDISEHQRYLDGLKAMNTISSNINLKFDEQFAKSLQLVCEYLNMPLGIISKIEGNQYYVIHFNTTDKRFELSKGQKFDLDKTYCSITLQHRNVLSIAQMQKSEYAHHPCYKNFNLESYIGAPIMVDGELYGTINFSSSEPHENDFSENDIEFIRLLAGWAAATIERQNQEKQLLEQKNKAEIASQAKSEFLSNMSHEIRTPMNAVIGLTDLLLQENPKKEQLRKLTTLKFSADNLLSLINDILDYSKIESGNFQFEYIDFNLIELISNIKESISYKAVEKNLKLKLKTDSDIPDFFISDPVRITQIISNIISNAIKFTEKGKVEIEIELEDETEDKCSIYFQIKDTGIGIAPDKQKLIFERFQQASTDTTRKYGGTGLGLSIVKGLLHKFNSEILIESELGKGTVFSFYLNLKKSNKSELQTDGGNIVYSNKDLSNLKILIAEDNLTNQYVLASYLIKWNSDFDFANNGKIAIEMLQKKNYGLIIMDLQMPVMDGYQATIEIKKMSPKYSEIPIIALTASAQLDVKKKVIKIGMVDSVLKPFNPDKLYSTIFKHGIKSAISNDNSNRKKQIENKTVDFDRQFNNNKLSNTQSNDTQSNDTQSNDTQLIDTEKTEELFDIHNIIELFGDNKELLKEAMLTAKDDFLSFKKDYSDCILNQDLINLSKAIHKNTMAFKLFNYNALIDEAKYGKELLKNTDNKNDLVQSIDRIKKLSDKIIKSIEIFINEQ